MAKKLSKYGSALLGFILVCVGIGALATPAPPLGLHPATWFVLAALLFSDSAWTHVARKSYEEEQRELQQEQQGKPQEKFSTPEEADALKQVKQQPLPQQQQANLKQPRAEFTRPGLEQQQEQ